MYFQFMPVFFIVNGKKGFYECMYSVQIDINLVPICLGTHDELKILLA